MYSIPPCPMAVKQNCQCGDSIWIVVLLDCRYFEWKWLTGSNVVRTGRTLP